VLQELALHCDFIEVGVPYDKPVLDGQPIAVAAPQWHIAAHAHDLATIPVLMAHHVDDAVLARACVSAGGFVYVAATAGLTGNQGPLSDTLAPFVARVRGWTELPICAGIGVAGARQAASLAAFTDGAIVGSAFVRCMLADPGSVGVRGVRLLARDLATAMRRD
jgi:tryptophan synthase alpha chain